VEQTSFPSSEHDIVLSLVVSHLLISTWDTFQKQDLNKFILFYSYFIIIYKFDLELFIYILYIKQINNKL
jgi:hypothetical protein